MKAIPLRESPGLKTSEIIKTVLERPAQGVNIGELRARCRVLDALDKVPPDATRFYLEDADHETLVRAVNAFTFGIATKDLLVIVDDILEAKISNQASEVRDQETSVPPAVLIPDL
jgi:hypothetical protein